METIFNPVRDWLSYLRSIRHMDPLFNQWAKNEFNLSDQEDLLILYNAIRFNNSDGECHFPWSYFEALGVDDLKSRLDKVANKISGTVIEYFNPGQCRKLIIAPEMANKLYNQMSQFNRNKMGKKITRDFKSIYKKASDEQDIKYSNNPTIEWISYLNNIKLPPCIIENAEKRITEINDIRRIEAIRRLIHDLNDGAKYIMHPNRETINYRIGGLFSSLKKEDRRAILPPNQGFIELDLKSAHLSFLAARMGLDLPSDAVGEIAEQTGLQRARVKEALVCTIYGGTLSAKDALIIDDARRESHQRARANHCAQKTQAQEQTDSEKLYSNELYKLISQAVSDLEFSLNGKSIIDAFGIQLETTTEIKSTTVLAAYFSSFEKKLFMTLLPLARKLGFQIVSDEHDGCTIYISNPDRKAEILKTCKNAVEKEAKRLGIKTTLEIK